MINGVIFQDPFEAHVVWNHIFAKYLVSFLIGHQSSLVAPEFKRGELRNITQHTLCGVGLKMLQCAL